MRKENRWRYGKREFIAPPLPKDLLGATGCLFQEAVYDPDVGIGVYLAMLENHEFCETLALLRFFKLSCKTGIARTSQGLIAVYFGQVSLCRQIIRNH